MPAGEPGPVFFRGVPLTLRAVPADGFRFEHWEGDLAATTDTATTTLTGETWVTAVFAPLSVAREGDTAPRPASRLGQSWPNPASGPVRIEYETTAPGPVSIVLFDGLGRRVATLADGPHPAGRHAVHVPDRGLPPGVYLYSMVAPGFRASRRMTVLR
jgi:hypothetical protein